MKRFASRDSSYLPFAYLNVKPSLPSLPPPPILPSGEVASPSCMECLFPRGMIEHETTLERLVEIPSEVRTAYSLYRPTPLVRAVGLERELDTPARIYYKYEGAGPAGSHKSNTALAQAFLAREGGISRICTETGAGQWGSALSQACLQFGSSLEVFMVRASYLQKPLRRIFMEMHGASVHASPSSRTSAGQSFLEKDASHPGSLGIAISEAVEQVLGDPSCCYSLGSVLDSVCLHQSVIGQEALLQMEEMGDFPDEVVACVGGGSNFAGIAFPFVAFGAGVSYVAVEPSSCPTLTQGELRYDYGDSSGLTPRYMMYTLGCDFVPPPIHAGGLRYHGMSPLVSHLVSLGMVRAAAVAQDSVFSAARLFLRCEGILPAPESAHAVSCVIDSALRARESGTPSVILFCLSGHGLMDMAAFS